MTDYKSMYYHLAGRMASAVDVLDTTNQILEATVQSLNATSRSLEELKEKFKLAQQITEDMFINGDDDSVDSPE